MEGMVVGKKKQPCACRCVCGCVCDDAAADAAAGELPMFENVSCRETSRHDTNTRRPAVSYSRRLMCTAREKTREELQ